MSKGKNSDCSSNNRNRNIQGVCRDSYIYPIELYHAFAYYLCFVPFRFKKSNTGCFIIKSWQIQKVIFGGILIDMYTYYLKIQLQSEITYLFFQIDNLLPSIFSATRLLLCTNLQIDFHNVGRNYNQNCIGVSGIV